VTVGKFSNLQKSGPAGNSVTFISASGLMTGACCATAADCDSSISAATTTRMLISISFTAIPPSPKMASVILLELASRTSYASGRAGASFADM
jgi:hypothetical protein